jgi:ABC-type phosphate/phosphonate transport system substrate-binding protein
MTTTLLLGAVAYDPKVVTIWDGFKAWFAEHGLELDYVLYENYERQVESQFLGHYHVAWNSPLAWLQVEAIAKKLSRKAEAIAMRDTDMNLTSVIVVRDDSPINSLADLKGRSIGVGAADSPQATLIPLSHLAEVGVDPQTEVQVRRYDTLLGKHGDHIGGERDAARALMQGEIDAACMIDGNHLLFGKEGVLPSGSTRILMQTGSYDHCNFTVLDDAPSGLVARFKDLLLSMRYDDPKMRPLFDLEGLKQWKPGRTEGYALLQRAIDRFGSIDSFVQGVVGRCR